MPVELLNNIGVIYFERGELEVSIQYSKLVQLPV